MTERKFFPKTPLDKKMPKRADSQTVRRENFSHLCRFFSLDESVLLNDQNSPWKTLAEKLMGHMIPGFQVSSSGRSQVFTDYSDYEDVCIIETLAGLKSIYKRGMSGGRNITNTTVLYNFAARTPSEDIARALHGPEFQNTHRYQPITKWMTKQEFDHFLDDPSQGALYEMAAKVIKKKLGRNYDIRADQLRSRHNKHKALCKKMFPDMKHKGFWRAFYFETMNQEVSQARYKSKQRAS